MSEFYRERRSSIRNVTSYVAFLVGFVLAGPYGWTLLRQDVEAYEFAHGVFRMVVALLGGGAALGIVGIGVGAVLGWIWERRHRRSRALLPEEPAAPHTGSTAQHFGALASARAVAFATAQGTTSSDGDTMGAFRYSGAGLDVKEFVALAQRACGIEYTPTLAGAALRRTINIGAWHGQLLVAAVRVLTDGQTFATVPELLVDPDYRRRGIGRELMRRAAAASPGRQLYVGAEAATADFFARLGATSGAFGLLITETRFESVEEAGSE